MQKIYNLIILDASGSMNSIYRQALNGANETIQSIITAQKDHPLLEQYLTLASFSSGRGNISRKCTSMPINEVKELTEEDYKAWGGTALFDAMGTLISELQETITHDDRVLVTVITDGEENASEHWSGRQIKSLVNELRQMGWTFTYIGANQNLDQVADTIGIRNTMAFEASEQGSARMFAKEHRSRRNYYSKMEDCVRCCRPTMAEEEDFFDDKD